MKLMDWVWLFLSIAQAVMLILCIKEQIEIAIWLRKSRKADVEKETLEEEKSTHKEINVPEWAEKFIDQYMVNPEKGSCR